LLLILGFVREPPSTAWVIFITPGRKSWLTDTLMKILR